MSRYTLHKALFVFALAICSAAIGQQDSTRTVQDAVYNRPFINNSERSTAVGGYVEGNTNYNVEDGITEGFSMELRRFNLFLFSQIGKRVKFLSELEFEHGTEEIALETAMVDFTFDPALNFRAGIILAPIGGFNQNHDSPQWDIVDRPLVSTEIIPSTLSEIGFGFNGKIYKSQFIFTYDAYVVNGLRDDIILNADGRTYMQNGKSEEMFGEDNNGRPMLTGKVGIRHRKIGEIGLSYYGGVYNTFALDGEEIDSKRRLSIAAVDFNAGLGKATVRGEFAFNSIDVESSIDQIFGTKQWGGYSEVLYPIYQGSLSKFESTTINLVLRAEAIDYNVGNFESIGTNIGDEVQSLVGGFSIRPNASAVLKMSYRYSWITDILENPTVKASSVQVGFATYF